ncbi:unnamed protein product [Arabis nemorensis]|uniref:Uncharacterized protein n=1 Tax=Arabis nemorensis TaxID=586526 RepID=A0A565BQ04_9BRAS|nr:unnamed protein product [Arabis nemorensis]
MVTFTPTASTLNHDAPEFRPVTPPNSVVPEPITSDAYAPVLRPPFTLNPDAPPYRLHPDKRSLFITLSNGFPLTESQICNFFSRQLLSIVRGGCACAQGRKEVGAFWESDIQAS